MVGDGGGGSRLEAKKKLPTLGTNFNPGTPLAHRQEHISDCPEAKNNWAVYFPIYPPQDITKAIEKYAATGG